MRFHSFAQALDASTIALPALLLVCSTITNIGVLPTHSLAIHTGSWAIAWGASVLGGAYNGGYGENTGRRKACWSSGALIVLVQTCERASGSERELWWSRGFIPSFIILLRWLNLKDQSFLPPALDHSPGSLGKGSKRLLWILTLAAFLALVQPFVTSPSRALGFATTLLLSMVYVLLEEVLITKDDDKYTGNGGFVSANGSISRRRSSTGSASGGVFVTVLRDVSLVAALGSAITTLIFESLRTDAISYSKRLESLQGEDWKTGQRGIWALQGIFVAIVGGFKEILVVSMVHEQGAFACSLVSLSGNLLANLAISISAFRSYFSSLAAAATYLLVHDAQSTALTGVESRARVRLRQLLSILSIISFSVVAVYLGREQISGQVDVPASAEIGLVPLTDYAPLSLSSSPSHPIRQLIDNAETEFTARLSRQSKSLEEAVEEYRRRYKISPPPNFDKWYQLAKIKGVQLVDEYDGIYDSLLPFWGLQPATIRARVRESLGFKNNLIGILIRDGEVRKADGGDEWQQASTIGMMQDFIKFLPDMDLAFNIHDEPRVVVPHEDLARLVNLAQTNNIPKALGNSSPRNSFSSRPADVNAGKSIPEVKTTRFNVFAHQPTWTNSRLSCDPSSPSRSLSESPADNETAYALSPLGFIYNTTAFSDICLSPSYSSTFGFFDRPNAFNVVHDLFPIFSQSKLSSFQDILYPSPWYWSTKVAYDADRDTTWEKKEPKMYWRGSTTGGFSRDGGWRRQHRQRVVRIINSHDNAQILEHPNEKQGWRVVEKPREEFKDLFDVTFSHVGQCDPGDCDAQKEAFNVVDRVDPQDAWKYRHLLDVDGNAFSGRFYAFLRSKSLVYKLAVFREWHAEWLKPWVHYVPMSLRGGEWVELVRWFEKDGAEDAKRLAVAGQGWANKVLRNEDMEVWFFRLLLEYARVIDDDRESIGFAI